MSMYVYANQSVEEVEESPEFPLSASAKAARDEDDDDYERVVYAITLSLNDLLHPCLNLT